MKVLPTERDLYSSTAPSIGVILRELSFLVLGPNGPVGLIGPRKFGGITNFCTIDRGQAVKVRTHLHFRIEVLFFGTIFKNSIFIVKTNWFHPAAGVVAERTSI